MRTIVVGLSAAVMAIALGHAGHAQAPAQGRGGAPSVQAPAPLVFKDLVATRWFAAAGPSAQPMATPPLAARADLSACKERAEIEPSPVVEVNRAVAIAFAGRPDAAHELLAPLLDDPALQEYQPLHAAHAELLRRSGDADAAARAYERAIELSANAVMVFRPALRL